MSEENRPTDPDDDSPADPPAAVQWMMQQAAAGQSAGIAPPATSADRWPTLAPGSQEAALAAREGRIRDALRGNERLTAGLGGDAAEGLMALGLDMARLVVHDTAGLDDTAAEDVLQPRVRAVRRLMMAAAGGTTTNSVETPTETADWLEQAAVALGDHFTPPDTAETVAFRGRWRSLLGRPSEQIAVLRRFIEDHTSRKP